MSFDIFHLPIDKCQKPDRQGGLGSEAKLLLSRGLRTRNGKYQMSNDKWKMIY